MVWKELAKVAAAGAVAVSRALARAVREEFNSSREAARRQASAATASDSAGGANNTASTSSASSSAASARRAIEREALQTNTRLGMTVQEAAQILNVQPPLDREEIQRKYEHMFTANDRKKGGTLYLQAKVFRAKERLDVELDRIEREAQAKEEAAQRKQS
ncbi:hypothetical protein niasHT_019832 [Heterodera trifolii]|uniref:Mitochondrial import inner membrane translocase subunit tim-16 n=1 Tax=Heterodera trifolii TaxID=157864 RepID=A0ABD2KWP6_9BILA